MSDAVSALLVTIAVWALAGAARDLNGTGGAARRTYSATRTALGPRLETSDPDEPGHGSRLRAALVSGAAGLAAAGAGLGWAAGHDLYRGARAVAHRARARRRPRAVSGPEAPTPPTRPAPGRGAGDERTAAGPRPAVPAVPTPGPQRPQLGATQPAALAPGPGGAQRPALPAPLPFTYQPPVGGGEGRAELPGPAPAPPPLPGGSGPLSPPAAYRPAIGAPRSIRPAPDELEVIDVEFTESEPGALEPARPQLPPAPPRAKETTAMSDQTGASTYEETREMIADTTAAAIAAAQLTQDQAAAAENRADSAQSRATALAKISAQTADVSAGWAATQGAAATLGVNDVTVADHTAVITTAADASEALAAFVEAAAQVIAAERRCAELADTAAAAYHAHVQAAEALGASLDEYQQAHQQAHDVTGVPAADSAWYGIPG